MGNGKHTLSSLRLPPWFIHTITVIPAGQWWADKTSVWSLQWHTPQGPLGFVGGPRLEHPYSSAIKEVTGWWSTCMERGEGNATQLLPISRKYVNITSEAVWEEPGSCKKVFERKTRGRNQTWNATISVTSLWEIPKLVTLEKASLRILFSTFFLSQLLLSAAGGRTLGLKFVSSDPGRPCVWGVWTEWRM